MIEAVNSVLANASLSRGSAVQASSAANVQQQSVAELPKAPYISPYIAVDYNFDKAVIQIRDSDTGDILNQFPSESRLRALQAEQAQLQAPRTSQPSEGQSIPGEAPVASTESALPVQSLDAGAIATLQAPQGVSTSEIQQAAVAFVASTAAASAPTGTVNVTA
jgi:hypothetical protein